MKNTCCSSYFGMAFGHTLVLSCVSCKFSECACCADLMDGASQHVRTCVRVCSSRHCFTSVCVILWATKQTSNPRRFVVCKSVCGSSSWDSENQSGITMQRAVSQRLLRAESCLHALPCWSSVVEEFRMMACIVFRSHVPQNLSALFRRRPVSSDGNRFSFVRFASVSRAFHRNSGSDQWLFIPL